MVSWKRRLEELVAEINEVASPAKIRKEELEDLIREQCREIIAEELQKMTADMLYNKIFINDPKAHEEPPETFQAVWINTTDTSDITFVPSAGTTTTMSSASNEALQDFYNMHGAPGYGKRQ